MKKVTLHLIILSSLLISSCDSSDQLGDQRPVHIIYDFEPLSGSIGSEIVIKGMHFSNIPEENRVKFNNKEAEVLQASYEQLNVKVPAGATSGKISVTVNGVTSISADDFLVR